MKAARRHNEKYQIIVIQTADPVVAGKRQETNSRSAIDYAVILEGGTRDFIPTVGVRRCRRLKIQPEISRPLLELFPPRPGNRENGAPLTLG